MSFCMMNRTSSAEQSFWAQDAGGQTVGRFYPRVATAAFAAMADLIYGKANAFVRG
jgi:hypothetical protein